MGRVGDGTATWLSQKEIGQLKTGSTRRPRGEHRTAAREKCRPRAAEKRLPGAIFISRAVSGTFVRARGSGLAHTSLRAHVAVSLRARRRSLAMAGSGPSERDNWNAILKWSLAQTDPDASAAPAREIPEADRAWFLEAVASGMVDEIKRMRDITAAISSRQAERLDAEELDARVALVEELGDRVCSVDNGGDLHTIGGLRPLVGALASPHARLRAAAAETLAMTVQNHPKAQANALECAAVAPLIAMAKGEGGDQAPSDADAGGGATKPSSSPASSEPVVPDSNPTLTCRAKALFALSCLTRGCPAAQRAFLLGDGFAVLRDCLRLDRARIRTKALHLARHVATTSDDAMAAGINAGIILSAAAALAKSVPVPGDGDAGDSSAAGQVREAALRTMLDVARCVDFEKCPKAVDHLRGAVVVDAINRVGKWYATLGKEERETHNDEMLVCAELAKMFG